MAAIIYFLSGIIAYFLNVFIGTFITSLIDSLVPIKGLSIITEPLTLGLFVLIVAMLLEAVIK
jgi:hypothetical protein